MRNADYVVFIEACQGRLEQLGFAPHELRMPVWRKRLRTLHDEPQRNGTRAANCSNLEALNGYFFAVVEHAKVALLQPCEERFGIHILFRGRGNDVDENRGRRGLSSHHSKRSNAAQRRGDGKQQGRFSKESWIHLGRL